MGGERERERERERRGLGFSSGIVAWFVRAYLSNKRNKEKKIDIGRHRWHQIPPLNKHK